MPSFLGEKLHSAFGQPTFLLAGNCMTTVAFEKEVSIAKKMLGSVEVLNLRKNLNL